MKNKFQTNTILAIATVAIATGSVLVAQYSQVQSAQSATIGYGGQVAICHVTGVPIAPYAKVSVSEDTLVAHASHGDIIPAPSGSCPKNIFLR